MKIEVKKTYVSKVGNVIEVFERTEDKDAAGAPVFKYKGKVTQAVSGHEALIEARAIHEFWEDGKWIAFPGGIHDLVKEKEKA